MSNNKKTWRDRLRAVAGFTSSLWDAYERLPIIWRWLANVIGAGTLSGSIEAAAQSIWGPLPWPMPSSIPGWALHIIFLVLVGLGILRLLQITGPVFSQLLAPKRFKELPLSLKNKLLGVHENQPVRTPRAVAWYNDLIGKGLIRETLPLDSNQAMVRPTPIGEELAEQWGEEKKRREKQVGHSPQQRETVNRLAAFFKNYIRPVYTPTYQLLERIRSDLSGQTSVARLLSVPLDSLEDSYNDLKFVAHHPKQIGAVEAKNRLCVFWKEYITAVRFIHDAEKDGITVEEEPYRDQYRGWRDRHEDLVANLQDMIQRPDMEGVKSYLIEYRFDTTFWDSSVEDSG